MPTYQIETANGEAYEIESPQELSDEELQKAIGGQAAAAAEGPGVTGKRSVGGGGAAQQTFAPEVTAEAEAWRLAPTNIEQGPGLGVVGRTPEEVGMRTQAMRRELGLGPEGTANLQPFGPAGRTLGRAGKLTTATVADIASLLPGGTDPGLENLRAWYESQGEAPLPIEEAAAEVEGVVPRTMSKAALAATAMIPRIGAAAGLSLAGAPAALAASAPMLVTDQGELDPVGALIAAGLPGVSRFGEKVMAKTLSRIPISKVALEVLSKDPLRLKGKIEQKLGGLTISSEAFRKTLEAGGGQVAANLYLAAAATPQILALPEEQRGEAILEMVAANMATGLLGLGGRGRELSQTSERLFPQVMAEWRRAMSTPPGGPRPLGGPEVAPPGTPPAGPPFPPVPIAPSGVPRGTPPAVPPVLPAEPPVTPPVPGTTPTPPGAPDGQPGAAAAPPVTAPPADEVPADTEVDTGQPEPEPEAGGAPPQGPSEAPGQEQVPMHYRFLSGADGAVDHGAISPEVGAAAQVTPAPVRVQRGFQNVTRPGQAPSGFGFEHIEATHGAEIRKAGYPDVLSFIRDVGHGFTQLWQKSDGRLVLVRRNGGAKLAAVQLRPEHGAYTVVTAHLIDPNRRINGRLLWERGRGDAPAGPGPTGPPITPPPGVDAGNEPVAQPGGGSGRGVTTTTRTVVPPGPGGKGGATIPPTGQPRPAWLPDLGPEVIYGRETMVTGARGRKVRGVFAWAPDKMIETSHEGPDFRPNTRYPPGRNTRDYENDVTEQEKARLIGDNLDASVAISTAGTSAEGLVQVVPTFMYRPDGKLVLTQGPQGREEKVVMLFTAGGNGRKQGERLASEERRRILAQVADREAFTFGLPAAPRPGLSLVRILDFNARSTPEEIDSLNALIDDLNLSPGQLETTGKMAINDAPKVPLESIALIPPDTTPPSAVAAWMANLIKTGVLDRNTRLQVMGNQGQLREYGTRIYFQTAFGGADLGEAYYSHKIIGALHRLMPRMAGLAVELRQQGALGNELADGITEMVRRTVNYRLNQPRITIAQVLNLVAEQEELVESTAGRVGRGIAAVLRDGVEFATGEKSKARVVDELDTFKNWEDSISRLTKLVGKVRTQGATTLLGSENALDVAREWLRREGGDKLALLLEPPGSTGPLKDWTLREGTEPAPPDTRQPTSDPRVVRLKKLNRRKEEGKKPLTQAEIKEIAALERELGRAFMNFWDETTRASEPDAPLTPQQQKEKDAAAIVAGSQAPLALMEDVAWQQGTVYGQLKLKDESPRIPGLDLPVGGRPDGPGAPPPRNEPVPWPEAARRRNPELELGGPGRAGGVGRRGAVGGHGLQPGAPPASAQAQDLIEARAELTEGWLASETILERTQPDIARKLYPHQIRGVNAILTAWARGDAFGLFDGTGAGKTHQELAAAAVARTLFPQDGPVLIVTQDDRIIGGAFASVSEMLGIQLYRYRGGPVAPGQEYLIGTYHDISAGKIAPGQFQTVILDEAHNLRGAAAGAERAIVGNAIADAAPRVLFATATPMDKPEQLWTYKKLLTKTPEQALREVGIETGVQVDEQRGVMTTFTGVEGFEVDRMVANLERIFDDVYRAGRALKREVPLRNLDVELASVTLTPEAHADITRLMTERETELRDRGVPERNIIGIVLQYGRGLLERYKGPIAVDAALRAVAEGRQVIIYGDHISTLQTVAAMLEQKLGPGSVGRLYGGAGSPTAQRAMVDMLDRYQRGELKVITATPEMGGAGLNMDDIRGDAPRDVLLLSVPYSALETVQIAGRVNRLTTRSRARMRWVITNHTVDRWNLNLSLAKLDLLGAAVKGEVDDIEPRAGGQLKDRPRRPARPDPRQLEFDALQLAFSLPKPPPPVGAAAQGRQPGDLRGWGAGGREGGGGALPRGHGWTTIASRIQFAALTRQVVDVRGMTAATPEDRAAIALLQRDPRWETMHWYFVKEGKVAGVYASTSRTPTTVYPLARKEDAALLERTATDLGADGIFISHNHPSDDPKPSDADVRVTDDLLLRYPWFKAKFLGHIVTDHGRVVVIAADGSQHPLDLSREYGADPYLGKLEAALPPGGTGDASLTGYRVFSGAGAAAYANHLRPPEHYGTVLLTDTKDRVRATAQLDWDALGGDPAAIKAAVLQAAQQHGAAFAYLYTDEPGLQLKGTLARGLLDSWLSDVIDLNPQGLITARSFRQGMNLPQERELWHSQDAAARTATMKDEVRGEENQEELTTYAFSWQPSRGGIYNAAAPMGVPGTMPFRLGGLSHVRPVLMPEAIRLYRELSGGRNPLIRRLPIRTHGLFYPAGPPGARGEPAIVLNFAAFGNEFDGAKTLLHEIGHWIDYLPQNTLKRGNVLGHLLSLRNHLRNTFGGFSVTDKQVRAELLDLAMYWRPWDPLSDPPAYVEYRRSATELYADALSVIFNSPGLAEQMAPNFYRAFWKEMDRKPAAKVALFGIQNYLARGMVAVLEENQQDLEAAMTQGDEQAKQAMIKRRLRLSQWREAYQQMVQNLVDAYDPIERRQARLETGLPGHPAGLSPISRARDPREMLDRLAMRDISNLRLLRAVMEQVLMPAEQEGITTEQLGLIMFYSRIIDGDRSKLANPDGITPTRARLLMGQLRRQMGFARWTLGLDYVQRFRDMNFKLVRRGVRAGIYNARTFNKVVVPNKDSYATFQVLDHFTDYVPAGIHEQFGTFEKIGNTFHATLLKMVSMNMAILWNDAKTTTVEMLVQHFPGDITYRPTAPNTPDPRPHDREKNAMISVMRNGRVIWYEVDQYIARAFEEAGAQHLALAARMFNGAFRKFLYPLIISYNPGFLWFLSPIREGFRTARNLAVAMPTPKLLLAYAQVLPQAVRRFQDMQHTRAGRQRAGLVREAEANFAIGSPFDTVARQQRDDFLGHLLTRAKLQRVAPDQIGNPLERAPLKWVMAALRMIEWSGSVLDTLPKLASYKILRDTGWAPPEAAAWVRRYAGMPGIHRKGRWAAATRVLVPFWNVFTQGLRTDLKLATNPTTLAGWWFRWFLWSGFAKVLMAAGASGWLGTLIKQLYDGISEYDKTNYICIPLGIEPGGDFGQRVVYIRIPQDEISRVLGGALYKAFTGTAEDDKPGGWPSEILSFTGGQVPGINPVFTVAAGWGFYVAGQNVLNPFTGRSMVPEREWTAGGWNRLKGMLLWTADQWGTMNIIRWDPRQQEGTGTIINRIPGINRLLKASDYGYREHQKWEAATDQQVQAKQRQHLAYSPEVQALVHELNGLERMSKRRTREQDDRYQALQEWNKTLFKRADQGITDLRAYKGDPETRKDADRIRRELHEASKPYTAAARWRGTFIPLWETRPQTRKPRPVVPGR